NAKAAFEGEVWQWHQDYGTWARDDGMPQPRAMNIAVFLDEVMPINGPLMFIPRSHKHGTLQAGHDKQTTSYPLWTLDKEAGTRRSEARSETLSQPNPGVPGFGHYMIGPSRKHPTWTRERVASTEPLRGASRVRGCLLVKRYPSPGSSLAYARNEPPSPARGEGTEYAAR